MSHQANGAILLENVIHLLQLLSMHVHFYMHIRKGVESFQP